MALLLMTKCNSRLHQYSKLFHFETAFFMDKMRMKQDLKKINQQQYLHIFQ